MKRVALDPQRVSALASVALFLVLALATNGLVARHYKRWDFTEGQRYSLSSATRETLRALPEPVHVWVLMSARDGLAQSVKQTLVAYRAESSRLDVKFIDPERDTLAFEEARKKFRIETARASEGQIVTDAVMVVFMGDKHRYISADDLIDVGAAGNAKNGQVTPREEQAITLAIRHVLQGKKTKLCFTRAHGELSLEEGSDRGLGLVRDILEKDNYETATVDLLAPKATLEGCDVVVVAGPRDAFSDAEDAAIDAHVSRGGGLLVAASPLFAPTESGVTKLGLAKTLGGFGIQTVDGVVVEKRADRILGEDGIAFVAEASPHATTNGLVPPNEREAAPRIGVQLARGWKRVEGVDLAPVPLLKTSDESYLVTNVRGAGATTPPKGAGDISGPIVIAMASERPKRADQAHGPRAVVLGAASFFFAPGFREALGSRGAAILTENAISWLGAKPPILDIPSKASVPAGIRITEASRLEVRRYVLFLMPGGIALLALALFFSRRGREGAAHKPASQ